VFLLLSRLRPHEIERIAGPHIFMKNYVALRRLRGMREFTRDVNLDSKFDGANNCWIIKDGPIVWSEVPTQCI
jgi:hypothetical protein